MAKNPTVNYVAVGRKYHVMTVNMTGLQNYRVRMVVVKWLMWIVGKIAPFTVEWPDDDGLGGG